MSKLREMMRAREVGYISSDVYAQQLVSMEDAIADLIDAAKRIRELRKGAYDHQAVSDAESDLDTAIAKLEEA